MAKPRIDAHWCFPNKATPAGSSAYYSVRFAPPALRDDIALLFAWRGEMRSVLTDCTDPGVARIKLQWWREELERCIAGNPRHPLTRILARMLRERRLPASLFLQMADAVESEVVQRTPKDQQDLEHRCEQDQGALFELIGRCHGLSDEPLLQHLRRLGIYCGLVYLIRDFGMHLHRGYNPLPPSSGMDRIPHTAAQGQRKSLQRLALRASALLETPEQPGSSLPFSPLNQAGPNRPIPATQSPRSVPPSIAIRSAVLCRLLEEMVREDLPVLDQRISLTPLHKLWIGWRVSHRSVSA